MHKIKNIYLSKLNIAIKIFTLCYSFLAPLQAIYGSESVLLELNYQPSKKIDTVIDDESTALMNIKGDPILIQMNRNRGITFPQIIKTIDKKHLQYISDVPDEEGSFKMKLKFIDAQSDLINQAGIKLPQKSNMVGSTFNIMVKGKTKEVEFISLEGDHLSAMEKEIAPKVLASIFSQMNALNNLELNAGKPVMQNQVLDIPLPSGMGTMRFNLNSTYTLKNIKDNVAYIDTTAKYVMDQNGMNIGMEGSGSGNGKLEYIMDQKIVQKQVTQTRVCRHKI